jgi:hypothetical protein
MTNLMAIGIGFALVFGWLAAGEVTLAQSSCTFTIEPKVVKIDGASNYPQVKPGATLCLPAGTRGNLNQNLNAFNPNYHSQQRKSENGDQ